MTKRSMKLRWLALATLLLLMTSAPAAAALYTIEYNEANYTSLVADSFTLDDFAGIDSATLSITLAGHTKHCNSSGYCWHYDSIVDVTAAGSTVLHDRPLTADFETIDINLDNATLASMLADDALAFSIAGQQAYWESDYGSSGYSTSRFYLDKVELNVTESSAVPIPGAVWLLGSGLFGLVAIRRRKKS